MIGNLKKGLSIEFLKATKYYKSKDYSLCFNHLERYHILSQAYYLPHLDSHWWMFKVGLKLKDVKEITGKLIRMMGSVGLLLGKYPLGNTGELTFHLLNPCPFQKISSSILTKPAIQNDFIDLLKLK